MNKVSRHSSRPFLRHAELRLLLRPKEKYGKKKSLSPDKMLFPARRARSLKCKGRKASRCISGRSHSTSRRAFCNGVQPHQPLEESPVEQGISRNGISHGGVRRRVWNSREMVPWERNTITPGCPFFGSFFGQAKKWTEIMITWRLSHFQNFADA